MQYEFAVSAMWMWLVQYEFAVSAIWHIYLYNIAHSNIIMIINNNSSNIDSMGAEEQLQEADAPAEGCHDATI